MAYGVVVEGLSGLRDIENLPDDIIRAARQTVNKTLERTRSRSAKEIRRQVAFPAGYLSGNSGRLAITGRPSGRDLTGEITGRHRPTSLARFAKGSPESTRQARGVSVTVKPGSPQFMPKAFLIRLRAGSAGIDTQSNMGLAIRLAPGESVRNKRVQMKQWRGLYLLYGPSVDQVFDDVAEAEVPFIEDFMEDEFLRLMGL